RSRNSFEYFDGRGMKQVSLPVKPVSIKPGTIHLVGSRTVGVHYTTSGFYCATYVQSGAAAVDTMVTALGQPHPPPSQICDRALEFTRATIAKMPL
ncbi:hypothetical protein JOC45_001632, partial [Gordonia hydrophobica]|nr:hypothetical protein [Gordonia hydrophobica]